MSFAADVKKNLIQLPTKGACCRRSFLFGALLGAVRTEKGFSLSVASEEEATYLSRLISEFLGKTAECESLVRAGRRKHVLSFDSGRTRRYFDELAHSQESLDVLFGAKCGACADMFLRGVFVALGTMNDPRKSYHVEFLLPNEVLAERLDAFLAELGLPARRITRGERIGLYYKGAGDIEELFALMNANTIVFELVNVKIERSLRNNENRATNCVTRNIARAVDASMKQVAAIVKLQDCGMLDGLPDELRTTALLRLEYDNVSLSELAAAHTPPISKSGLNHRLEKLMILAEKVK